MAPTSHKPIHAKTKQQSRNTCHLLALHNSNETAGPIYAKIHMNQISQW